MKTHSVTTFNPNTEEEKVHEFEADLVRNEGSHTVFYKDQTIVGMVRTDFIVSFEVL